MSKYLIKFEDIKLKEDFKLKCLIDKSTMKKKIIELIKVYTYGGANVSEIHQKNNNSLEKYKPKKR